MENMVRRDRGYRVLEMTEIRLNADLAQGNGKGQSRSRVEVTCLLPFGEWDIEVMQIGDSTGVVREVAIRSRKRE